jgi:hypothetical protein
VSEMPDNLTTLPTMPYPERPEDLPLDIEECRTALWLNRGNITDAAAMLKVRSSRLRAFVSASPYLQREVEEAKERLKDKAMKVIAEGLDDDNEKYTMARFVAKELGAVGQKAVRDNLPPHSRVVFQWDDGTSFDPNAARDNAQVIEGELVNADR